MKCSFFLILAVSVVSNAGVIIEGMVKLPAGRSSAAAAARYQQKSGAVALPEPPSAVVFLEGSFPASAPPSTPTNQVSQKNFQFMPALLPVRTGASVVFPNLDDDFHHVCSYSKTKKFDLGRYRKEEEKQPVVTFDKPGTVKIGCEIHDHMQAVILVLDTPHFVKTDAEGKYQLTIKNIPAGKYVLKAWVDDRNVQQQTVELKEGSKVRADFPGK
ncbi:MAG: hypothetical protein FJ403_14370 [Verrucomicrobia bacterium]|nr:hypothetical protein [Verrucomicrobiota bacterium]